MDVPRLEQYEVKLTHKNGKFHITLPELCLLASAPTPDQAYEILEGQFKELCDSYRAADSLDDLPKPRSVDLSKDRRNLRTRLILAASISAIFLFTLITAVNFLEGKVKSIQVSQIVKSQAAGVLEIMAVWNNMDDARKNSYLDQLEIQLEAIKPIVDRASNVLIER